MTTIVLPSDLEAWAQKQVLAGRATSVDDAIADAVREHRKMIDTHADLVAAAYASIERGDVYDEDVVNADLERWIAEDAAGTS